MAGIQFDFTGDNSSFIKTVEQVQSSIQHTTKVLGEVGKYFDVSNVVEQIDALTRTIRSNEESISNSKKQIADWMKQAEEARNIGDFATSDIIQLDISNALNDIETYNKDIEDTKRALLEIMNIGGEGKAPMLFDTQEDYDKVQRLKEEIVDLHAQIANFNGSDEALEGLRGKLSATEEELRKMELSAAQNAQSLGAAASVASEASNHYYELTNKIKEQEAVVAELTLKFYDAEQAMKKALASNNVQDISDARVQYDAYAKGLEQARHQLISLNNEQENFHKKMQQMANGVDDASSKIVTAFKNIAAVAGVSFTLNQAKKFVDEVVSIRSAMQDLETSTKIFLGSEQAASNFNEQLKNYSMKSLFHYNELMAVSHQMLGIGMSAEEAMHKIDQLANIAAATHASLSSVVGMYTRASAMGSVANRQIVSWQKLGVNVKQVLKDMGEDVTKTSVSFEQLQKVIDHVTAPGGKFANAQQDMLGNISAEIDTYKNKMELMFNEIGEDYQEYIVGAIKGGQWLIENYKEIGTVIMDCIAAYGAYRAAIIAVSAAHKLNAFWETASAAAAKLNTASRVAQTGAVTTSTVAWTIATKSIKANTTAMLANAAAALTNPYVLLGAAIAALTFGVYKLATADDAETAARKRANEEAKKFNDTLEERKNHMMELVQKVQDVENVDEGSRNLAWQELSDKFPALVSGYKQAQFAALSFGQAQKEVNQVLADEKYENAKKEVEKYKKEVEDAQKVVSKKPGGGLIDKMANYFHNKELEESVILLEDAEKKLKDIEDARNKVLEPKDIKNLSFEELLDGYAEASEKIDEINGKEVNPNIDTEKIREAVGWARGMLGTLENINEADAAPGVNAEQIEEAKDKARAALSALLEVDAEVADPDVKREKIDEAEKKARKATDELEKLGKKVAKPQVEAKGLEKTLSKVRELWDYLKKILGKGEESAKAPVKNTKGQTASKGDFRKQVQEKIDAAETDEDVDKLITTLNKKKKNAKYGSEERSFYEKKLTELQAKKKKNETKSGGADGSKRKQGTLDDELKQLQEQFKTEQDRRRSLAELRLAQIQNEAVKEQEAQKEASRQKWESIASEELSAYKKLYDDAKKQFELKNKNKNKVFDDTAEAKEIMNGIRAYVDYYSQRNNLARTANEELEKTNGGIKVFDEAKLDTSKEKLAGLLEMLKGIQDKKVVVESETKDMTKVEVTGDVDDVKAIKQMASEDTSFTVTMKVEQIGSIEIPKDKTFTVTGRYEGADLADITKKVNSLPKTAETVINTSLGKIQKADINENATVEVETVVDSKQYDELVKKLGKDAVQKVTTEVTGDEIPTVEDKTMAVRIRVDKSKIDDLKKSVPKEMPVKIYSDAKDFKMPKIKDKVTVDVNYKVNSDELDKVKHPKGGTITYNTDVKGLDTIEKLGDKNVKITATVETDKVQNFSQAVAAVPTEKIVTIGIEQVGELPQVEDKMFTVRSVYDGKEVKDGLAEIPAEANIKVSTTLDNMPTVKDGEMEITAHVTDDDYQELVKKYGKDIVQKVTLDTTDVKTGMQAVQGMDGKTVAIAIKTTGENLQTIAEDVKALDTDATLTYHINADELPQVKDNEVVEVEYKANTEQIKAAEEKLKANPTTTITYNVVTKGYEYVERINNLPTEKTVTIRAEQIGKVEIPDVEDKVFTVTGHYDGSETDKIKEIPSKADVLVTTKVDSKQYDDLAKRFKGNVSILVDVNDKKALEQLQGIKNLHIDPKEVVFRADNKDALQAAKQIQGVHIDEKTFAVYADSEEAMKKLTAMNGMTIQPKTLSVTADTKKAKNDLMAVDGLVKDKKMSVVVKTTGDKLPEVKGDDTVTYTYKANTEELEEVTPPQDATVTYTIKVQGQEALQGLKVPADQTYTVTMALKKVGSIEMPKDGTFTISAHLQGEDELKKITELPKEADVTINTKLGDIKKPDIPTDATIEVTTDVSAADYEKLKAQLGEDAVQVIHTKVEGDAVPQVKDQTMTVYVKTDKTGLTNLQNVVGKDVTAKVNTKAGKVNLPKIDKNATVDVKYNVDSSQVDEAAAKLHDGTVTYHVNVEGKEQLDALGDKSISIKADASKDAQAQAKLLGEAFKQSVISAQQLSDAGLDKSFIDKLKNGTYSADELARAIILLQNAIDGLDKNSEKYKGLYNSLDDDTKAILKNKEALQSVNDANTDRERQKKRLEEMRQYFEQYGSLEQKRQAIIEKFEKDINDARKAGYEGQARILEEQLKEKKAQMSIENITKGIDWSSLFNGIGTMSKEMMKQTRQQLQAYMKSDQFRSSGAENQEKVVELMNQIKQYLGSEDVGWRGLGDAMVDFNSAVVALEQAQTKQEAVLAEYLKAKQAKDEAVEKKEKGTISEEAYNAAIDAYNEATKKFNEAGKAVKEAQDSVQSFGNKLNAASDGVVNFVSKLDVQLKEMEGIWGRFSGFSDLQKASQDFSSLSGQLGNAAAEEQAQRIEKTEIPEGAIFDDGMGNMIDPNVMKEAFAEPAGGIENALGKLSNITSGIGDVMGEGLSGLLGSTGSMVAGIVALPSLIVQAANAIKSVVTGILNGIADFLRLEWLSDLIVSIFDAIANVVDAIFDLPESIAHALEAIVSGIGNAVGNIVGRIGSIFGLGGGKEDHEAQYQERISELTSILEDNSKALEKNTEAIKNNKDYKAPTNLRQNLDSALEQAKVDRQTKLEVAKSVADDSYDGTWYKAWSDGYHSWIYERNDTNDKWNTFNAFNEALQKGGSRKSINGAGDLFSLSPEEIQMLMEFSPQAWKDMFRDVGSERDPQEVKKWLEEYASTAGKERDLWLDWYQSLTKVSFDSLRDNFKSNILDMSKDAKDFVDDFNNMIAQSTVEVMMNIKTKDGKSFTDKLKDWQMRWGQAVESDNKLTQAEKEALQAEYEQLTQEALEMREQVKDITGDLSKSSKEQQSATFNSAKNITYEQADALVGIEMAKQIILEQIKAWLYKQDFSKKEEKEETTEVNVPEQEVPVVNAPEVDLDIDIPEDDGFDYGYLDEIVEQLREQDGDELEQAAQALYQAVQSRINDYIDSQNTNPIAIDNKELEETVSDAVASLRQTINEHVVEIENDNVDYDELMSTFRDNFGKVMVSLRSVAAKVGVDIPTTALQGVIPQQEYDNLIFEEQFNSILESVKEQVGDNLTADNEEGLDMTDLKAMMVENSIANEQNAAQVVLISQNLQTLKDMTATTSVAITEIRNLVMEGNSVRESILKVMRERYESFDSKLTQIYRELQEQS